MGFSRNVIAYAKSQVGMHEGFSNGHWNNKEPYADMVPGLGWVNQQREAWCAVFDFACLAKGGCGTGGLVPTAGVAELARQGRAAGRFTEYPTLGGLMVIGGGVHTEIVVGFDSTRVMTVGGNTNSNGGAEGDGVHAHTRLRSAPNITGYVIPFYDEHAVSADPHWNGKWLGAHPESATPAPASIPNQVAHAATPNGVRAFSLGILLAGIADRGKSHGNTKLLQEALLAVVGPTGSPRDGIWRGNDQHRLDVYRRDLNARLHLGWTEDDCTGAPGPSSLHILFSDPRAVKALGVNYSAIVK